MKKISAVLIAISMLLSLTACGSGSNENSAAAETTQEIDTTETVTDTTASTQAESETDKTETENTSEADKTSSKTDDKSDTQKDGETKLPSTKAEILAEYTKVMNQAKKDAPGFTKTEYQELPEEGRVINKGATLTNAALKIAGNFMSSKEDVEADPEIQEKGNNMRSWPVGKCPKGCMLTDPNALKSAKCEKLANGNYKITIVLNDELNPEPAPEETSTSPSFHGGVFRPASKAEIDEALNGGIVSAVFKDIKYSLTYHDSLSSVEYNPKNNHVVSVIQTTRVSVSGSGKAMGASIDLENQELVNYMHIYNVKY